MENTFELLYNAIEPEDVDVMSMSVGDVVRCMIEINDYIKEKKLPITRAISFAKGFTKSIEGIFKTLNRIDTSKNAEWERATSEVEGLTSGENILCETVEYYNLHSTEEAAKLPFSDWFIMKRREIVKTAVERRYQKIIEQKQKERNGSGYKYK